MNIGDIVNIAIQPEILMVVTEVDEEDGWVECVWFNDDKEIESYNFPIGAVVLRKAAKLAEAAE